MHVQMYQYQDYLIHNQVQNGQSENEICIITQITSITILSVLFIRANEAILSYQLTNQRITKRIVTTVVHTIVYD